MEAIKLVTVEPTQSDLALLISKLDAYLDELYPSEEVFKVDFDNPKVENITFVMAYCGEVPVGCGAISPLDDSYTELKRFYVDPLYRRHGIAMQILSTLEYMARDLAYVAIKLETGDQQPEAIHFYEKHGFIAIERYGEYVNCKSSLCYEKTL